MGAKKILAINVRRSKARKTLYRKYIESDENEIIKYITTSSPNLFIDFFKKSYDIMASALDEKQIEHAKVPVVFKSITMMEIKYKDFLKWKKIISHGKKLDISEFTDI